MQFSTYIMIFSVHYANYLNINTSSHGWSLEEGYDKAQTLDTYPRRALLAGAKNALSMILLSPKKDIDYACTSGLQGYKVNIFNKNNFSTTHRNYLGNPPHSAKSSKSQTTVFPRTFGSVRRGRHTAINDENL